MAMVAVDSSSLQADWRPEVSWLGLRVGRRLSCPRDIRYGIRRAPKSPTPLPAIYHHNAALTDTATLPMDQHDQPEILSSFSRGQRPGQQWPDTTSAVTSQCGFTDCRTDSHKSTAVAPTIPASLSPSFRVAWHLQVRFVIKQPTELCVYSIEIVQYFKYSTQRLRSYRNTCWKSDV